MSASQMGGWGTKFFVTELLKRIGNGNDEYLPHYNNPGQKTFFFFTKITKTKFSHKGILHTEIRCGQVPSNSTI